MGYYVSFMIGIRCGGVFSDLINIVDFKKRIKKVLEKKEFKEDSLVASEINLDQCMSQELVAHKGSYIILAGICNYLCYDSGLEDFAKALSKEFGTEVMIMTWDEEVNKIDNAIFLDGELLLNVNEDAISQVLRRIL